jgi:hypothetical protein
VDALLTCEQLVIEVQVRRPGPGALRPHVEANLCLLLTAPASFNEKRHRSQGRADRLGPAIGGSEKKLLNALSTSIRGNWPSHPSDDRRAEAARREGMVAEPTPEGPSQSIDPPTGRQHAPQPVEPWRLQQDDIRPPRQSKVAEKLGPVGRNVQVFLDNDDRDLQSEPLLNEPFSENSRVAR